MVKILCQFDFYTADTTIFFLLIQEFFLLPIIANTCFHHITKHFSSLPIMFKSNANKTFLPATLLGRRV